MQKAAFLAKTQSLSSCKDRIQTDLHMICPRACPGFDIFGGLGHLGILNSKTS